MTVLVVDPAALDFVSEMIPDSMSVLFRNGCTNSFISACRNLSKTLLLVRLWTVLKNLKCCVKQNQLPLTFANL